MKYKCTNSFDAANGSSYSWGDTISSSEYNDLKSSEQSNFTRDDDSDSSSSNQMLNIAMGDMLGIGIPGGLDGDMSTLL